MVTALTDRSSIRSRNKIFFCFFFCLFNYPTHLFIYLLQSKQTHAHMPVYSVTYDELFLFIIIFISLISEKSVNISLVYMSLFVRYNSAHSSDLTCQKLKTFIQKYIYVTTYMNNIWISLML